MRETMENGSLIKILPLAFIDNINYETIENISSLTHRHGRSKIACVLYVEIARPMISNSNLNINEHVQNASAKIIEYYKDQKNLVTLKESLIMITQKEFQVKVMLFPHLKQPFIAWKILIIIKMQF